jgi:hypothetical protein
MSMFLLIYNSPSLVNVRNKSSWRHFLADIAAIVTVYLYCRFAEMNRQLLVPYLPYAANIQPNYYSLWSKVIQILSDTKKLYNHICSYVCTLYQDLLSYIRCTGNLHKCPYS